ncbi:MFS transporter [Bacillus sp. FJAT-27225]|uniref:MFS transporter n=1 Tax=Bacillus sp. FJAT-27225 TaxID=1743144 RepID=UPI00080C2469|nr:MFS transporter [Bacillus sp. FJAT-27225]OCA87549.1 MFS transporter [Bacillus sp. FJAT-27225]
MQIGQANRQSDANTGKSKIWTRDFLLICLANFFVFLGFQMTLPTIPLFVEQLGGNDQMIGFVVGAFTLTALLVRPFAGQFLETLGRRFVFLTGLAIFVISVGAFGYVSGFLFLFLIRFIQGAGWGFSTTASGTIATDLIPPERRGEGMGYYGLSGNLALAMGPSLGLILAGSISFKTLFLICSGLGLAALLLSSTIRFKQVEKSAKTTVLKWDFYEKSALQPAVLMFFITVTFGGIAAFLPLYTAQKGIGGIEIYFLIYALALMVTRAFAGQLYDKKGHRAVIIPGTLLILLAMVLLAWLPNEAILYTAATLYGFGFGTIQPGLQAWSIERAPKNRRGMANATFFSFFDLGIGIGSLLFGQIGHVLGYSSIYWASAVSVLFCILFYFFLLLKEGRKEKQR